MTIHRVLVSVILTALIGCVAMSNANAEESAKKNKYVGHLRHVVLLKFTEDTTPEKVAELEKGFVALAGKIPAIVDLEWGTDCSVEGLNQEFTHAFLVTFKDAKGRDEYLPHPAHQAFVEQLKPHLDKVLVIDYIVRE